MKKIVLLLGLSLFVLSCKNNKKEDTSSQPTDSLTVTHVIIDSSKIAACQGKPCPKIYVDYIKLEGDTELSKAINNQNEAELIKIFDIFEGKPKPSTIEEAVNAFAEDYFKFKQNYPKSMASYEADVSQKVISQNEQRIVFKTGSYIFTGGAHGYSAINFYNFDAQTGALLTHQDMIADIPAFTDFVEEKFRQKYQIPPKADINAQGFFFEDGKFALPHNIAVLEDKVVLLYNPYEAASYAQGQLRFVFPKKTVEQWLK